MAIGGDQHIGAEPQSIGETQTPGTCGQWFEDRRGKHVRRVVRQGDVVGEPGGVEPELVGGDEQLPDSTAVGVLAVRGHSEAESHSRRLAVHAPTAASDPGTFRSNRGGIGHVRHEGVGGMVPRRPASKSSNAWPISALVFITKGP